jgi:hypothetical protein
VTNACGLAAKVGCAASAQPSVIANNIAPGLFANGSAVLIGIPVIDADVSARVDHTVQPIANADWLRLFSQPARA